MRLLILGGTRFLGRAIVSAALDAGHHMSLFNRGQTNPDLFPKLELIRGDRDGGLHLLANRQWDAVIDTCGYVPRLVRASAAQLAPTVDHYTFISSISVYADPVQPGSDEEAPLAMMADESVEEITGETYGPLKVLCEEAASEEMDGRALHVRAGLIVGPHDPTDRFTHWPHRVALGGQMLAPGEPSAPVQFIDVRDLARWIVSAAESRLVGPYNATGPTAPLTFVEFLKICRATTGSDASYVWVDEPFLLAHEVSPFTELPLWVPEGEAGILQIDTQKAQEQGLTFRPLAETIRETLQWSSARSSDHQWRNGLSPEREQTLLKQWSECQT